MRTRFSAAVVLSRCGPRISSYHFGRVCVQVPPLEVDQRDLAQKLKGLMVVKSALAPGLEECKVADSLGWSAKC